MSEGGRERGRERERANEGKASGNRVGQLDQGKCRHTLRHIHSQTDQYSLDHPVGVRVGNLDGSSDVPGHVDHGHDGFHLLHLVPLKTLQCQLILIGCRNTGSTSDWPFKSLPQQPRSLWYTKA